MDSKSIIFVAGCPGAGKDTMAQRYVIEHDYFSHFSMGDIYRQIGTGEFVSKYRDVLFNDFRQKRRSSAETTTGILFEAIVQKDFRNYIISGFPHHLDEVNLFNSNAVHYDISYSGVIFFDVSQSNAITRMSKRGLRPMESLKLHEGETPLKYYNRRYIEYMSQQPFLIDMLNSVYEVEYINANGNVDEVYANFCCKIRQKLNFQR